MTQRRIAAVVLFLVATGFVAIAALTPLRSAEVGRLDAEAQQLGEQWVDATQNLAVDSAEADRLLQESNAAYRAARDLEPAVDPIQALGFALLAVAGGVALWPSRPDAANDVSPER